MTFQLQIQMNEKLFLRDPAGSELGKRIIGQGAIMLEKMGLEDFTFKKLAAELGTNESSIYRYFENKHRLLLYLVGWYWRWMEYQIMVNTASKNDARSKIDVILRILLHQQEGDVLGEPGFDKKVLRNLITKENAKSYLTNHVTQDNQQLFFKPYKDVCARIAAVFSEINPKFPYCRSLTSTILEMAHHQHFFMHNLPSLTDFGQTKDEKEIFNFLKTLIYGALQFKQAVNGALHAQN